MSNELIKPASFKELNREVYNYLTTHRKENYTSGIEPLDRYLPFQPGQINLIGARTGAGKTRLALKLINNYAIQRPDTDKRRVCYFSTEDTTLNFQMRFLEARLCGAIKHRDLINQDIETIKKAKDEILFLCSIDNFKYYPASGANLNQVLATLHDSLSKFDPNIIIFDYIQAIQCPGNTYEKHSMIAESLRHFVNTHKVLFFGLCQLNREQDDTDTPDKALSMAGLQGSGVYEQVANSVTLIKRVVEKDQFGIYTPTSYVQFYVRKNRDGGGVLGSFVTNEHYQERGKPINEFTYYQPIQTEFII